MQVSVEKISEIERRITVVLPASQVEEAVAKKIDHFAKKANIKGFRPGKAPLSYIQKRFGDDARREAMSEVIETSLYKALHEEKLRPVSTPKVEPKRIEPNQPFEFSASFEVLPEIEKVVFSLDNIEKLIVEVTDQDIDYVVSQLTKQYTKWQVVDRAAKEKDRVVIDYYTVFEGKSDSENKIENFPLELGSRTMLPGFEKGLIDARVGDEKRLSLTFPDDLSDKEKAGKPIEFVVTIKQIFEAEQPLINDDFVKKLGIKTGKLEDLHTQIRQSLELEKNRLIKEKLKEQLFTRLLEQNAIEVPSSLVEREAKSIHDEVYANQSHDHHQHSDDELAAFKDVAKKRVALGLLIAEYAKTAHLKADKLLVQQRIEEIASAYEHPQEVVAWLSTDERRSGIESQVLEDQVMEKLMENIPVTEKTISYAELKGIRI